MAQKSGIVTAVAQVQSLAQDFCMPQVWPNPPLQKTKQKNKTKKKTSLFCMILRLRLNLRFYMVKRNQNYFMTHVIRLCIISAFELQC